MQHHHFIKKIQRSLLIVAGTIAVILGVIGIVLPVLPTTPFLLLAAACYVRASQRCYQWLITNRWLGDYIRNYREGRGIPLRTKIVVIACLWLTIGYSALWVVPVLPGKILLFGIAVGVTYHLTVGVKTLKPDARPGDDEDLPPTNECVPGS